MSDYHQHCLPRNEACPNGCAYHDHSIGRACLYWTDERAINGYSVWANVHGLEDHRELIVCDSELEASDELHRAIEGNPSERMKLALCDALLKLES